MMRELLNRERSGYFGFDGGFGLRLDFAVPCGTLASFILQNTFVPS